MPHLSGLQDAHAEQGLTVLGVTRPDSRNSLEAVQEMTAEKADVMRYTVAWDGDGATYKAYMDAAEQRGIPTAFLVDKQGKIAFIGHPAQMDIPLAGVLAGTWDPVEGPKRIEAAYGVLGEVWRYTGGGLDEEQKEKVLEACAKFEKEYPDFVAPMRSFLFALYLTAEHEAKVKELGAAWLKEAKKHKDAAGLNELAWSIVDPESAFEKRDLDLALKAATAAVAASESKDASIIDTLARVHAWRGEWEKAIQLQRKAVELATEQFGKDAADGLRFTLEEYLAEVEATEEIIEETVEEIEE